MPDDSAEILAVNQIAADTAERNADAAHAFLFAQAEEHVEIVVLKFSRSPRQFKEALDVLEPRKTATGAKVVVRDSIMQHVLDEIGRAGIELFTSHVLVERERLQDVVNALMAVPSRCQLGKPAMSSMEVSPLGSPGDTAAMSDIAESVKSLSDAIGIAVKHTFVH